MPAGQDASWGLQPRHSHLYGHPSQHSNTATMTDKQMNLQLIDTHIHLDGNEFDEDREATVQRAREAGVRMMLLPAVDIETSLHIRDLSRQYPGVLFPMVGLHPEEVGDDFRDVLARMEGLFDGQTVAVGEVGLDFYWSREYEQQQLEAFEIQVGWAVERRLPLMIHCRKAQNELVGILRKYEPRLAGGVFHCFAGNAIEAAELLSFDGFALGIGGILTFNKSKLPEVLPEAVPPHRVVLETDAPYMAPVPVRGRRNESAYLVHIVGKMAQAYGVPVEEMARITTENTRRIFRLPS